MQEFRSRQSALTAKQRKEWRGNMEGIILEERKRLGALLDTHTQADIHEVDTGYLSTCRQAAAQSF